MRAAIAAAAAAGRPVLGECGGLMYLGQRLITGDGDFPMCGALPISTQIRERRLSLGYRELTTTRDTPLGPAGTVFRGHLFHYSTLTDDPDLPPAYRAEGLGGAYGEGWQRGGALGSYVHAHWRSNPRVAAGFARACAAR